MAQKKPQNIIDAAIVECKKVFWIVLIFSMILNILMLALPIYSLQVLNRVLSSGSYSTLWMLTIIVAGMFVALALFHSIRAFTLTKVSEWLDNKLSPALLAKAISSSTTKVTASGSQNLRDFTVIKNFFTGGGIISLFDLPWSLIYLTVIFIIHPYMGFITLLGGVILLVLAILNEYATRTPLEEANEIAIVSLAHSEIATRNAEAVEAMGMGPAIIKQWEVINNKVQKLQSIASNRGAVIMGVTKFTRLFLQVGVIGLGAHLVLVNHISAGAIIACSILVSRALSPFESSITVWKTIVDARKSYERLKKSIEYSIVREKSISLPKPEGHITVDKVVFYHPGNLTAPILKSVSFNVRAGETLAILGPSASGKSTLAKLLVGVWKPTSGIVRLDNADVFNWNREDFGKHVGYVPQDVELFKGTVKENIARLQENPNDQDIIAAAKLSGAHDMILHLQKGYETDIGVGGSSLSGGQRQRIALARAFYGDPRFIVLDEPNASLDEIGESMLIETIKIAKAKGITCIIVSHRNSILSVADKIAVMRDGQIETFGPANDVIEKYRQVTAQIRQGQQSQNNVKSLAESK